MVRAGIILNTALVYFTKHLTSIYTIPPRLSDTLSNSHVLDPHYSWITLVHPRNQHIVQRFRFQFRVSSSRALPPFTSTTSIPTKYPGPHPLTVRETYSTAVQGRTCVHELPHPFLTRAVSQKGSYPADPDDCALNMRAPQPDEYNMVVDISQLALPIVYYRCFSPWSSEVFKTKHHTVDTGSKAFNTSYVGFSA